MASTSRIGRAARIAASRYANYSPLQRAVSSGQCVAWAQVNRPSMFNGNAVRARIIYELFTKFQCDFFIETGTSHAATSIGAHKLLGAEVLTCENSFVDYLIASTMTLGLRGIRPFNLESQAFLPLATTVVRNQNKTPLIYLDAHEGRLDSDSLPLRNELKEIFRLDRFVCVIDDFKVSDGAQYRFGTYGQIAVELALIQDVLKGNGVQHVYLPNYEPSVDTGFPSGYCVFWNGYPDLNFEHLALEFPLSLLQRVQIH